MRSSGRHARVRTFLVGLVLACLLPGVVGAAFFVLREYRDGLAQREKDTVATARALVQAVDNRWLQLQALGQALATAGALAQGDLRAFHRRSRELIAATGIGANVVLTDESGKQVVNTLRDYGEALPRHGNPEVHRRVFASARPVISDVYLGAVAQRPLVSIDVPVKIGDKVAYDLSVGILPEHFEAILRAQSLPPDRVVAVFDSSGTIVARTHAPERFVGEKGSAELVQRMSESREGVMEAVTREGIRAISAYSKSPDTGWSVAIGIPKASLESELRERLLKLAAGIAVLFAIGLGLAVAIGERIARSVLSLVGPALALGSGERAPPSRFQTRETAEVSRAIDEAARLLDERTQALRKATRELEARGEELEQQVAQRTTALLAANRELERVVREDPLTGLQNRLSANERLHAEFVLMKRTGAAYAVLLMDVDHFKAINDAMGHEAGDQVLRQIAQVFSDCLRESDFVARFGGEEFLALLPHTSQEGALKSAEKVRRVVAERRFPPAGAITVSIGVATADAADRDEEDILRRADTALYDAKRAGRNTVRMAATPVGSPH